MTARVLVVDDDELTRRLLARAVEAAGYRSDTAVDGADALDHLRSPDTAGSVDVVLLDVVMPRLDGFATLQEIKGDRSLQHLPVLLVSAVDEMDNIIQGIELGATDYLTKPVHGPLLRARLHASLAAKRLRDFELDHLEQVDRVIQAAVAIEQGTYATSGLDAVAERDDALGTLARVFREMTRQVRAREAALRAEVDELRIEIDRTRLDRRVAEVTGSEYYRRLSDEAADLKRILTEPDDDRGA